MGVDTHFFVRTDIGPREVERALIAMGKKNVNVKNAMDSCPGYVQIYFDSNIPEWNRRQLNFHFNVKGDYFGMTCNLLSLRMNEEGQTILETLAKMFGGIYQPSDTTEDCVIYQPPGSGNIRWVLEQYFASNVKTPHNCDDQIKAFVEYNKKGEV